MGMITRRAAVAGLLPLLVAVAVIALPSQVTAAPTHHSYTYKGWTATWSQTDYDDLQVNRTPDKENSGSANPDAEVGKLIINTWAERYGSPGKVTTMAAPDGCTNVPDGYGAANFKPACNKHDKCYGSSADRITCDKKLRSNLKAACKAAYPNLILPGVAEDYNKCMAMSNVYYEGVRKFGKKHYAGSGNPA